MKRSRPKDALAQKTAALVVSSSSQPPRGAETAPPPALRSDNEPLPLPPHTLRLLKLIAGGTPDHAALATNHLYDWAGTCSTTPVQLWHVLGCLEGSLSKARWKTRQQAAGALEAVATLLPPEQQAAFLQHDNSSSSDTSPQTTLPPPVCESSFSAGSQPTGTIVATTGASMETTTRTIRRNDDHATHNNPDTAAAHAHADNTYLYLTLQDLADSFDSILASGRPLWAASTSRYEAAATRRLARLDAARQQHVDGKKNQNNEEHTFVEDRVRLQRHLLAEKLGLANLTQVLGGASLELLPTGLDGDDLDDHDDDDEAQPLVAVKKKKKRASRKRRKQTQVDSFLDDHDDNPLDDDDDDRDDDDTDNPKNTIRALLVLEMKRSCSHAGPQSLLATELVYRMFDPAWQVRHGACLGTLSLLRAWTKTTISTQKQQEQGASYWGAWSRDVLARAVCVLCLDRFGDFAGTAAQGAVVAPVREVAGQLLAVLWTHYAKSRRIGNHDNDDTTNELLRGLLQRMCRHQAEWEVRHGALVALKCLVVVIHQRQQEEREEDVAPGTSRCSWWLEAVGRMVQDCLTDSSDDVQSAAAQVLLQLIPAVRPETPSDSLDPSLVQVVWQALASAKPYSSCLVDLVALFCRLLDHHCQATHGVLLALGSSLEAVCLLLLQLADSDFGSVRACAIRSIGQVAQALASIVGQTQQEEESEKRHQILSVYQQWMERIFVLQQQHKEPSTDQDAEVSYELVQECWTRLVSASSDMLLESSSIQDALQVSLLCRFFGLGKGRPSIYGDDDGFFAKQVASADALAEFILVGTDSSSIKMSALWSFAIECLVLSPWKHHCEGACLLIRALAQRKDKALETLGVILNEGVFGSLSHQSPVCLQIRACAKTCQTIQNPGIVTIGEQAFLDRASKIQAGHEEVSLMIRRVMEVWIMTLECRGWSRMVLVRCVNLETVQLEATLAGAGLVFKLPQKITPLARALVTSFNHEPADSSRQSTTSKSLVQLLEGIRGKPGYEKAQEKLLSTICDAAVREVSQTSRTENNNSMTPGQNVLSMLMQNFSGDSLKAIPIFWERLQELLSNEAEVEESTDSLILLQCVCNSLTEQHPVTAVIVDMFVPVLVRLGCQVLRCEMRAKASACLKVLCTINPHLVLRSAIPLVRVHLRDLNNDLLRLTSCRLLKELVDGTGSKICPFVRSLLPLAMSLMTDTVEECAKTANGAFAALVHVAPLVRQYSSVSVDGDEMDRHGSDVLEHLIFGKPLPPTVLPNCIGDALRQSGVKMRSYQMEGVSWLRFLQTVNLSGALCDSMGLGKTLQALVGIALAHHAGVGDSPVSLIVCPSTVVGHWMGEIRRFFPGDSIFRPFSFQGSATARKVGWVNNIQNCNIIVTSYATLRSEIDLLSSRLYCYCVLDEGHLLKNPKTATARASRRIRARHRLILTGTPVQNRVYELWATFDFLMPSFLGNSATFTKDYARPITQSQATGASATSIGEGMTKLKALHQQVLPFILRREKEHVLRELPPKNISLIKVQMSEEQASIYKLFCAHTWVQSSLDSMFKAIDQSQKSEIIATGGVNKETLKSVLFLRLLCTHPCLVHPEWPSGLETSPLNTFRASGKMRALADILREAGIFDDGRNAADNDSSLLYCEDDDVQQDAYQRVLGEKNDDEAAVPPSFAIPNSKCLIFAQFTKSLDAVEQLLFRPQMPGLRYLRLDGRVQPQERTALAERFNNDPDVSAMLLTTRVGGLGLNLTGADTVIFLESDFNPFADLQAMDRAHRLGQKRTVNVYRIVTEDSIEERILELQQKKVDMSNAIVNTDNSTMYSMGTDRLLDIVATSGDNSNGQEDQSENVDLDALAQSVEEDYVSFSAEEFLRSFKN